MAAGMNPFRRKHMQVLGLDNSSFVSSRTSRSSEDGSSTISHYSDRASAHSAHSRSNSVKKVSMISLPDHGMDENNGTEARGGSRDGDGRSFSYSAYNDSSDRDSEGNPFDEDEEDDSLDELEDIPTGLRRRRTVPNKAGSMLDSDHDNPWRTSTRIGNHSTHRRRSPDSTQVPLKAQKTLGLTKSGSLAPQEDFRRSNSLSPGTDNVAPKAQRMLGIPSNPFNKRSKALDAGHLFHDELERHGSKGPTSMSRKPVDVDEFKRMILSGERNFRDSTSTADISSLSRDSILSSQPDTHIDTPRSSQELLNRPTLTRIATDSAVDTSASLTEPWSVKPFSPVEMGDTSPVLNKPLPKTPGPTFELAGSEPAGSIAELPSRPPIAEMPADPVVFELAASEALPGSSNCPIELPAREASPVDPPFQSRSHNTPYPQFKSAPQHSPPRRARSYRSNESQRSTESFHSAAQHLTPQKSDSSLSSRRAGAPMSRSKSQRQASHSNFPLNRSNSTRLERSIAQTLPPASVSTPDNISIIPATPNHKHPPPAPPPSRPLPATPDKQNTSSSTTSSSRPITPTGPRPRNNVNSPQSRLPPISTGPTTTTPKGTPIADSMVSAATSATQDTLSPAGVVSAVSPSSPATRRAAGLNLISKVAGNQEDNVKNPKEVKNSKEVMETKDGQHGSAGVRKRELKPRAQNHQREWSWEPGKIDRLDSIKMHQVEARTEETIEEEASKEVEAEEKEEQRSNEEERDKKEHEDNHNSENQADPRNFVAELESPPVDIPATAKPAKEQAEPQPAEGHESLDDMRDLKRDIDAAIQRAQAETQPEVGNEGKLDSAITLSSNKYSARASASSADKESLMPAALGSKQQPQESSKDEESQKPEEGNWI